MSIRMEGKKESLDKIKLGNLFQDPPPLSVLCKLSHYIHLLCFSWPTQLSLLYNKGAEAHSYTQSFCPFYKHFLPQTIQEPLTSYQQLHVQISPPTSPSLVNILQWYTVSPICSSYILIYGFWAAHHITHFCFTVLIFLAIRSNHLSLRWWTTVSVEAQEHRKLMILCWHFRKLD